MLSTLSSSFWSSILFAFGANLEAKARTLSGNVAEKRIIWMGCLLGRKLRFNAVNVVVGNEKRDYNVLFHSESLIAQSVLIKHVVGLIEHEHLDMGYVEDLTSTC
ncbi:hypothetical protein CVT25_001116 [Psilocybe cyanescens]|uniref:Uncharacterized protein n=1 Tax=Psilocybe cyanescens TaxID=93625 RepID=A0A409XUI6_PSICY|nr:hypothetical protein CVT25_001116 [Psilocybe cyanescens]